MVNEETKLWREWKEHVPVLYDWFLNHHLTWPTLCCRWGNTKDEGKHKRKEQFYLSERTDGSAPNKLMVFTAEVTNPRVAAADFISNFSLNKPNPCITATTTILHPGEVNKIREVLQNPNVIVTHTDAPELYVWNTERQRNRANDKKEDRQVLSVADLVLTGHTRLAEYALSTCGAAPLVASGGQDTNVLLWNLADYDGGSLLKRPGPAPQGLQGTAPTLANQCTLQGHANTVEDVVFKPGSDHELASVGDDYSMRIWDTRAGTGPAASLVGAHGNSDVHCVDWNSFETFLLATGAADGSLKVWDPRKLTPTQPLYSFKQHKMPIMRVEWAPYKPGILASGGEDNTICIWNIAREEDDKDGLPPQLILQHPGHKGSIADFQWHPKDPYTMLSVSESDGGTLQIWRISELIWKDKDEVIKLLEPYKDYICAVKGKGATSKPPVQPPAGVPPAKRPRVSPSPGKKGKGAEVKVEANAEVKVESNAETTQLGQQSEVLAAEPVGTALLGTPEEAPPGVAGAAPVSTSEQPAGGTSGSLPGTVAMEIDP